MMKRYDPRGEGFLRLGRYDAREDVCTLWWSGSGVRTRVDGRQLELEAEVADSEQIPWLAVSVDGAPVARFPLRPGQHRYAVLEGMERGVAHEVAITRDTQPHDSDLAPLKLLAVWTDGEPTAPDPKPRLIEFIGDSLTVGEGTVGARDAMEWRMAWISNTFAYPTRVAEKLNAEKRVVALGGWGTYKSWDEDPECRIGRIYGQLCGVVPGGDAPYDFSAQRQPDAVVINLGTNDNSAIDKQDPSRRPAEEAQVTRCAEALLAQVRNSAPRAHIVWAYGLCGNALEGALKQAVRLRREAGDDDVFYLPLTDCGPDIGARSHPGRKAHKRAAKEICRLLNKLL